jgi:hypothetical protein
MAARAQAKAAKLAALAAHDNPRSGEPAKVVELHPTVEEAIRQAARGNGHAGPEQDRITAENLFDHLETIRKANPTATVNEKPVEVFLAVRKPKPKEYFRVCPDREMQITLTTYVHKPEGTFDEEHYLVTPSMEGYLGNMEEGAQKQLVLCVTDKGVYFFWPLPIPEGTDRPFITSARKCARMALTQWLRIKWRRSDNTYHPHVKEDQSREATWPKEEESLAELLKRAFGDRIIDSPEHKIIRKDLRGLDNTKPESAGSGSDDWL